MPLGETKTISSSGMNANQSTPILVRSQYVTWFWPMRSDRSSTDGILEKISLFLKDRVGYSAYVVSSEWDSRFAEAILEPWGIQIPGPDAHPEASREERWKEPGFSLMSWVAKLTNFWSMLPWNFIFHRIIHVQLPTSTGATCALFLAAQGFLTGNERLGLQKYKDFASSFICILKTGEIVYGFYLLFCHVPHFANKKQNRKQAGYT